MNALPPGTRFGEFEIVRVLGIGGFGIVYLARDHSLERDVALKEYMPASLATRGQGPQITVRSAAFEETYAIGLRSFVNEARLLARFDHASLVKVYRYWEDNATAYMVMPYLQGITLRDTRRAMTQPPDGHWIRSVIDPIMSALEELHRAGVYHRDIAPDNILLPAEGPPVLLEFGAARRVISDRTHALTVFLKAGYAPIEQYADLPGMKQGPWTDVYALAAVAYFAALGQTPPPSVGRLVNDTYLPLSRAAAGRYSPNFLAAVDCALAVKPGDRTQSIAELRREFDVPLAVSLEVAGDATVIFRPPKGDPTSPASWPDHSSAPRRLPSLDSTPAASRPVSSVPRSAPYRHPTPPAAPPPRSEAPRRLGVGSVLSALAKVPLGALAAVAAAPILVARGAAAAWRWATEERAPAKPDLLPQAEEPLMFGVSAPRSCLPDSEFTLAFMAYVASARTAALHQVEAIGGRAQRQLLDISAGGVAWRIGTPFTVRASGRAFAVEPQEQTFKWSGHHDVVGFAVHALPNATGPAVLTVLVLVEGTVIATLPLEFEIGVPAQRQNAPRERLLAAPQTLFASYASKDSHDVAGRLSTLVRWAPGLDIFQDCLDLRPNEDYKPQLTQQITARDAFLLFWSGNASKSKWVLWELQTALRSKPRDAILPMPLEDPALAPPPPELADLHFRDRFLLAGYAMQSIAATKDVPRH
jgi:serine/threonine protein kinase